MKHTHKLSFGLGLVLVAVSMNAIAQNQSTPMQHMQHMQQGPMSMQGMIPHQMSEQRMAQMQSRRA